MTSFALRALGARPLPRQRGNTLTGIIIGLIVGLGIAVAVALLITKGSTPFTDKSGKLGKMSEPTPGQVADPNKPLYGNKEAAIQANKEIAAKARPADDPLGEAVAAMENTAAPGARRADEVIYYLQAGAFREMDDAENTRAKLALLGFEASISERANESGVLHRVRIGPFPQVETMNKARAKLIDSGIDVAIVKNQN